MMVIRPIESQDLSALVGFAESSGVGVTTLPNNPELLENRIFRSIRSFRSAQPKERGNYVFAMHDSEADRVVGVSAIEANVGLDQVWYNYRLSKVVHASKQIGVHSSNQMLYMTNDLTGVSELCTLFLDEHARQGNNGRLLSKCRLLFLAEYQDHFASKIVAEMRGVSNKDGISPFWESLGKKFFQMDFSYADYQVGLGNKEMVAELMPKYPIYLFSLSPEARAAIAHTHENTRPAQEMLKKEGFHFNGYVDIFDGGPVMEAFVEDIRGVRESRLLPYKLDNELVPAVGSRTDYVVSNRKMERFRAVLVSREQVRDDHLLLSSEQAEALLLEDQAELRLIPLRYE